MGIPQHYSRDIAQRCQALIRHLRPIVQEGLPDDHQFGGPLATTFLLAMATPMIVLPVERIFKPVRAGADVPADDRQLDPALADAVGQVLGPERAFADAPFYVRGRWSYAPGAPPFKLADNWPYELLERLGSDAAFAEADITPAQRILLDLRNALAHGGIAYLDANGHATDGEAAMLAFASARTRNGRVTGVNVLRAHQDDFCDFVLAWADWLAGSRAAGMLNEQDPIAA
ncbi:MAG: hypothetical protein Kow0032_07820 [Methyloligellaceae bacterium]